MIEYYGNNDYRDYLMHYGVKDMKWGKRKSASDYLMDAKKKLGGTRLAGAIKDVQKTKEYNKGVKRAKKEAQVAYDRYRNASKKLTETNTVKDGFIRRAKRAGEYSENDRLNQREITRGMGELKVQGERAQAEYEKLKKQKKFHKRKKRIN